MCIDTRARTRHGEKEFTFVPLRGRIASRVAARCFREDEARHTNTLGEEHVHATTTETVGTSRRRFIDQQREL